MAPLAPASTDWADEASYTAWSNDVMRREWQRRQLQETGERKYKRQTEAPKFREEHFWGFGWWERIMGRKGRKDGDNDQNKST